MFRIYTPDGFPRGGYIRPTVDYLVIPLHVARALVAHPEYEIRQCQLIGGGLVEHKLIPPLALGHRDALGSKPVAHIDDGWYDLAVFRLAITALDGTVANLGNEVGPGLLFKGKCIIVSRGGGGAHEIEPKTGLVGFATYRNYDGLCGVPVTTSTGHPIGLHIGAVTDPQTGYEASVVAYLAPVLALVRGFGRLATLCENAMNRHDVDNAAGTPLVTTRVQSEESLGYLDGASLVGEFFVGSLPDQTTYGGGRLGPRHRRLNAGVERINNYQLYQTPHNELVVDEQPPPLAPVDLHNVVSQMDNDSNSVVSYQTLSPDGTNRNNIGYSSNLPDRSSAWVGHNSYHSEREEHTMETLYMEVGVHMLPVQLLNGRITDASRKLMKKVFFTSYPQVDEYDITQMARNNPNFTKERLRRIFPSGTGERVPQPSTASGPGSVSGYEFKRQMSYLLTWEDVVTELATHIPTISQLFGFPNDPDDNVLSDFIDRAARLLLLQRGTAPFAEQRSALAWLHKRVTAALRAARDRTGAGSFIVSSRWTSEAALRIEQTLDWTLDYLTTFRGFNRDVSRVVYMRRMARGTMVERTGGNNVQTFSIHNFSGPEFGVLMPRRIARVCHGLATTTRRDVNPTRLYHQLVAEVAECAKFQFPNTGGVEESLIAHSHHRRFPVITDLGPYFGLNADGVEQATRNWTRDSVSLLGPDEINPYRTFDSAKYSELAYATLGIMATEVPRILPPSWIRPSGAIDVEGLVAAIFNAIAVVDPKGNNALGDFRRCAKGTILSNQECVDRLVELVLSHIIGPALATDGFDGTHETFCCPFYDDTNHWSLDYGRSTVSVFIKNEPHSASKIREGRLRLIQSPTIVDEVTAQVLLGSDLAMATATPFKFGSAIGMGFTTEHTKAICHTIKEALNAGPLEDRDRRANDFSMTFRHSEFYAAYLTRVKVFDSVPQAMAYYRAVRALFARVDSSLLVVDGDLWCLGNPGVNRSGSKYTIHYNTFITRLTERMAQAMEAEYLGLQPLGPPFCLANGDDAVARKLHRPHLTLRTLGFMITDNHDVASPEDDFEFCSHKYHLSTETATPLGWAKSAIALSRKSVLTPTEFQIYFMEYGCNPEASRAIDILSQYVHQ